MIEKKTLYYVTMTDRFFSLRSNKVHKKISKLVFICDSLEEAEIVQENANHRTDQKNVNICFKKPYYSSDRYIVTFKTKQDYPSWYQKGFFNYRRD